jgi:hypothetical protein
MKATPMCRLMSVRPASFLPSVEIAFQNKAVVRDQLFCAAVDVTGQEARVPRKPNVCAKTK